MFLSTHPSPTLTMVISGAYPSHAALKHINHGKHKELGLIRLEIKCFWFKHAIRLYNFSICRHWCQKRCLICDKRIMTKHSTYCARQMPNATWKNWKNGTLCCGLGLCLGFAFFVFVAFASVFPFPVHGRLELCVHVAPRIRCGAATSQNEKMDF